MRWGMLEGVPSGEVRSWLKRYVFISSRAWRCLAGEHCRKIASKPNRWDHVGYAESSALVPSLTADVVMSMLSDDAPLAHALACN